ncbi:MAG TPA: hypothetical protein ENG31_03765 [Candidatus Thorarchaeota archaeon]|nr:MAG: hypothetical protein DRO93_05740 [Candidatus Thorarchaeota archaeon]HDD67718.1 hypothetical protein [Candidatus Thorarchaeota archaeon]
MSALPVSVVVDTNFLTVPVQLGIDIFSEAESVIERQVRFVVLQSVVSEIDRRIAIGRRSSPHFRVARELVNRCEIVETPQDIQSMPVDDQLLEYASRVKGVLATNDRRLRQRARSLGVPVLMIRGRKRVVLEGTLL